jgi:hypothetical protein
MKIQVLNSVKVPDGRVGKVTMFSDADHDIVDGHSTVAKVMFEDCQWGYYPINDLTRI